MTLKSGLSDGKPLPVETIFDGLLWGEAFRRYSDYAHLIAGFSLELLVVVIDSLGPHSILAELDV